MIDLAIRLLFAAMFAVLSYICLTMVLVSALMAPSWWECIWGGGAAGFAFLTWALLQEEN